MPNNFINADLVFHQNPRNPEPDEIQPVNESELGESKPLVKLNLINYNILYPLPYEQMNQRDRLSFKENYIQNITERENRNRGDVSDFFANSTCLALTCCSTQGFFFAISEVAKAPICFEITIPLAIVSGCFVYGGVSKCPEKVIKFPARSLNSFGYVVKDFCAGSRDRSKNEDLIYIDSEDNKKLREEFEKIKTKRIFYDLERDKYYVAQSVISWDGEDIKIRDEERISPDTLHQTPLVRLYPFSPDALWQPPASLANSPRGSNFENFAKQTIPSQLTM